MRRSQRLAGNLTHFLMERKRSKNQGHDKWQCKENYSHGVSE
jgi:hypothetical protein